MVADLNHNLSMFSNVFIATLHKDVIEETSGYQGVC